jgi:hypothetical protein
VSTDGILHEANERTGPAFRPGQLYSMLDILGGGIMTCDNCGRWQRLTSIPSSSARSDMTMFGWTFPNGKDLCRICSKPKAYESSQRESTI